MTCTSLPCGPTVGASHSLRRWGGVPIDTIAEILHQEAAIGTLGAGSPPGLLGQSATGEDIVDHDGPMGSDGSKPRKRRHRLDKVPKYEELNRAEGFSGGSFGRVGHSSDGHHAKKPGRVGSYVLRVLGRRPKY
jgi:hypothetical protein